MLHQGWSKETCIVSLQSRWNEQNPCLGQSDITALLVQKCFGGDIFHFKYSDRRHYFNKIDDTIIDLAYHEAMDASIEKYNRARKRSENSDLRKSKYVKLMDRYSLLLENSQLGISGIE